MNKLSYPVQLKFHIATFSNDFTAKDANGQVIAYTRQKKWRLKEHVQIYENSRRKNVLYEIKASNWLDFNTSYAITKTDGGSLGKVSRKGVRSIWSASYIVFNAENQDSYSISEENPFIKFIDATLGEIPFLGFFTGYFLNPTYIAKNQDGKVVLKLKKNPSFFGRKFSLEKIDHVPEEDETLLVLSFMMMILLERNRG